MESLEQQSQTLNKDSLKTLISKQIQTLLNYEFLINFNILEYFLDQNKVTAIINQINALPLESFIQNVIKPSTIVLPSQNQHFKNEKLIQENHFENEKMKKQNKKMKEKKSYEIEKFNKEIIQTIQQHKFQRVYDIGCGQGYLSDLVSHNCQDVEVVGIDYSNEQIKGAQARFNEKNNLKFEVGQFPVDFHPEDKPYMMMSLHGCGDLFRSIVSIFQSDQHCKAFMMVSCCYNLISIDSGVLMSQPLPKIICNRDLLMLGCQCADVSAATTINDDSIRSIVYRCAFQAYLQDHHLLHLLETKQNKEKQIQEKQDIDKPFKKIGKINIKKVSTFADYARLALTRLNQKSDMINPEHCQKYQHLLSEHSENILRIWNYRSWLGLVVESLIVADRLLYLQQSESVEVQFIHLFDRKISTRNTCISAIKKEKHQN